MKMSPDLFIGDFNCVMSQLMDQQLPSKAPLLRLPFTISDHAPVVLKLEIGHRPTTKQWRLNTSLLNDKGFISFITEEFKTYLEANALPESALSNIVGLKICIVLKAP